MDKDEKYPEFLAESGDSEEVEILEVVGVETNGTPSSAPPRAPSEGGGDESNEYLLEFDDPGQDERADRAAQAVAEGSAEESGESDHQRLLRVRADYDNLRKRIDRERREFQIHANCELVGRLLPVVDNLERALATDTENGREGALHEGVTMIYRQLMDQLRQDGLQPIESVGKPFDPNLHDAVATDPSAAEPANTIVDELQKGYLFQGRVLRPAMVAVSTGETDPEEDA